LFRESIRKLVASLPNAANKAISSNATTLSAKPASPFGQAGIDTKKALSQLRPETRPAYGGTCFGHFLMISNFAELTTD
jgi:hypothetical protein